MIYYYRDLFSTHCSKWMFKNSIKLYIEKREINLKLGEKCLPGALKWSQISIRTSKISIFSKHPDLRIIFMKKSLMRNLLCA